ncbi:conserved hypothetical protein [Ricinus communis]|uniref:Uncharacterized protein n=1 Tax=Ricinus communis TaxID=3988 RepID=B9SIW5_RICCO|nr:conserved hypothetical protein [Ricinus communis]
MLLLMITLVKNQQKLQIISKRFSMNKVATALKTMRSAVVKFGEAMTEARRIEPENDILNKTFNSVSEMYNNLTSYQKEKSTASRNQDQDNDLFSDLEFLKAVAELENAILKQTKVADQPTFSLKITPDEESRDNQLNEEDVEMFNNAAFSDVS